VLMMMSNCSGSSRTRLWLLLLVIMMMIIMIMMMVLTMMTMMQFRSQEGMPLTPRGTEDYEYPYDDLWAPDDTSGMVRASNHLWLHPPHHNIKTV